MSTDWLSLDDIAAELDVPVGTVYSWRYHGSAPRGYKIGKHIRVRRSDFEAWLEQRADQVPVQAGLEGDEATRSAGPTVVVCAECFERACADGDLMCWDAQGADLVEVEVDGPVSS